MLERETTVIECVVLYKCIYTVPSCRVSMVWMLPNILQWSSSDIRFSLSIGWKKICHTTGENIRSLCSLVPKPSWLYLAVRLSEKGLWEAGQNKTLCSQVVHVRTCVCSTWRYVLCRNTVGAQLYSGVSLMWTSWDQRDWTVHISETIQFECRADYFPTQQNFHEYQGSDKKIQVRISDFLL